MPFQKEIDFLKLAENLKKELRHGWLSDGTRESVAEHAWRLSLMAWRYADRLETPVDLLKCLKLAIAHDLCEAEAGDVPILDSQTTASKALKATKERQAMENIKTRLADAHGNELFTLWHEYETQATPEARYIKALDRLEAFLQHNEGPVEAWEYAEKEMLYQDKWLLSPCRYDPFLKALAEKVIEDGRNKLKAAGEDLALIEHTARQRPLDC